MTEYTSTTTIAPPFSAEEMLRQIRELAQSPIPFGSIMGIPVYVSGAVGNRTVEIRSGNQVVRFSENRPHIQGTKLSEALKG